MMFHGVSPGIGNSGDPAGPSPQPPPSPNETSAAAAETSATGGFSEDERGRMEDGGRNSGGNRWPRQETLSLLKIRSDMDVAFRDSSLKGPLWDEVSRKLAELGYHRSAKKCKEKFENVYKYHKRTKEGRTSKADGKTYRFFDQLQALEANPIAGSHHHQPLPPPPPPQPVLSNPSQVSPMPNTTTITQITTPSVVTPMNIAASHQKNVDPISVAAPAVAMSSMNINPVGGFPFSHLNVSAPNSSSSSTSSDEEPPERRRKRKRKRKWKEFFGRLMKEVIDKQEELQSKFLDTLERRERDRMAREEAWRMQEMAKMKREHELLVQERSMVAAKDAAVITFLQKITEQNPNTVIPQMPAMQLLQQQQQRSPPPSQKPPPPPMQQQPLPQRQTQVVTPLTAVPIHVSAPVTVPVSVPAPPAIAAENVDNGSGGSGGDNMLQPSPSRWPKAEINALIRLRTTLDTRYQETGPKGPLWEEISSAMRNLGYNRNPKRCKEKWENINKYYKKVKESSKKRPEDSKTCPYFHQLDAIYREKNNHSSDNPSLAIKSESQMAPIMARPEQQWSLSMVVQEHHHQQHQQAKTNESKVFEYEQNADQNEDDYDEDDEEEEEGGEYEIVPNKTSSMAAVE